MRAGIIPSLFIAAILLAVGGFPVSENGWPLFGGGMTIVFPVLAAALAIAWLLKGMQHMDKETVALAQVPGATIALTSL